MSDRTVTPPAQGAGDGKDKAKECKQMLVWLFEKKPAALNGFHTQLWRFLESLRSQEQVPASTSSIPASATPGAAASTNVQEQVRLILPSTICDCAQLSSNAEWDL